MTTDSELATLQEKVKRLTNDRDVAMKMAARSDQLLKEWKTEAENYRQLWQRAEARMHKTDTDTLVAMNTPPKKKRTVSDWIATALFIAVAVVVVYVFGWVLAE